MNLKEKVTTTIRELRCSLISSNQANIFPQREPNRVACLTIFHDYEGEYARKGLRDISYKGVSRILDIEKKYKIKTTFNTVGRLINDVPEIISRILADGHEIANHTYSHEVMTGLSKREIVKDIEKAKYAFEKIGVDLTGFRSPKGQWSLKLMDILLEEGYIWSAEVDKAAYPYVLRKKNNRVLVRMPIVMDDWAYESKNVDPEQMFNSLMSAVKKMADEKRYGAIGFHPWVQAIGEGRLETFERFVNEITSSKIKVVTFGEMAHHLLGCK